MMNLADGGWAPPSELGEYVLVQPLGRGSMGRVYLAYDSVLARLVAVKFITGRADTSTHHRFLVEARAAARIQHPNVVTVFRAGEVQGRFYLVSEYVRGQALDRLPKPVPWLRALDMGVGLARGLAAAHACGVLHRDIKPANAILADDGHLKLLDFGLAKLGGPPDDAPRTPVHRPPPPPESDGGAPASTTPRPADRETLPAPPRSAETLEPPPLGPSDLVGTTPPPSQRDATIPPSDSPWNARLTVPGALMGTPTYLSPEGWDGQAATTQSDVYSLGVVLYELCAGVAPYEASSADEFRHLMAERPPVPLAQAVPDVDPRLAAIVDRCLERDPARRFASGEALRDALEELQEATQRAAVPAGNPYRGLRTFEADHRALFFGRRAEIAAVLDRLRTGRFVFVTSDSGIGKSSLCRAGVLPLVREGTLGGPNWRVASFYPGRHPATALAEAIGAALGWSRPVAPADLGREVRSSLGPEEGLVIFIDQLEELITQSAPAEAEQADRLLRELAISVPGTRLLATLRADFLTRLATLPSLGPELARGLFLLTPLTPDRAREAIEGPAAARGVRFESPAMVEELVRAAASGVGGLPLVQFALAELWEQRDEEGQRILASALDRMGGVTGALARHADALLASLRPAEQAGAREVLTQLVGDEGVRLRKTQSDLRRLDAAGRRALEALVHGRLVVAYDAEHESGYEIAHESLVEGWGTLRAWLREDAERRLAEERLARSAQNWQRLGGPPEALWGEKQLAESARFDETQLPPRDAAFLRESRARIRRQRVVRRLFPIGVLVIAAIAFVGVRATMAWERGQRLVTQRRDAEVALDRARALVKDASAARAAAFARFDALDRRGGERLWSTARQIDAQARRAFLEASHALEAALAIDGNDSPARALLSTLNYERALHAELDGRVAERDELAARLRLYDEGSGLSRLYDAPATVRIFARPANARLALTRYDLRDGHLVESAAVDLGPQPIAPFTLAQGSYVLSASAPDRATTRLPFVARRGEDLHLELEPPPERAVPEGFVYVPRGRFLFGSAADDDMRRDFYETVPLHAVTTGPYLIQRHEVTFDEWIRFLEALPPVERGTRTPRVAASGVSGSLRLVERAGESRWELRFQPGNVLYRARLGEKLVYAARKHHAAQDWRKMPVGGIDAEDALAYVQWLRTTRRVPGARLCTEMEWERAARGADGREFPHGARLSPDDANYDATYGKDPDAMGPDEVGSHPRSVSPFGVHDLVGNVFEWTLSSLEEGHFVGRGGSSNFEPNTSKATNRHVTGAKFREARTGLRVCADAPPRDGSAR